MTREFDLNIERVLEKCTVAHALREVIANALAIAEAACEIVHLARPPSAQDMQRRGPVLLLLPEAATRSVGWRQVFYLLLGQAELDTVLDTGHRADRDRDLLAPPQMPLLEQHVGHPVVVRVDQEALDPPDLTVEGMDGITAVHVCLTQRDNILENGLYRRYDAHRRVQAA